MHYLSFALLGIPYSAVGRNLAYRRSLFFENKGFASHLHIASGDDDLFVSETANRYNTAVEIHPESFTSSEPKTRWSHWIRQKRRHYTTSFRYKKTHKRILSLELISREFFFLFGIILLIFWQLPGYVIIILLLREILFAITFKLVMNRLKERNLLLLSLIYDIIWPVFAGLLVLRNKIAPKNPKWK
jgi:cellulose synthase/poly-beta-1,6-N-acetylglucosamine synthase-like glycosyltransferase